ncbi:MAG: hypothetical protein HC851_12145 [Acaryochloris sp. RU_4_1]|nr:hypothetical protein [Acaryochloris sp. RU_4_1]NJR54984.1 hypothetical protein [Acaryochloris sp. CRU_2_0]
MSIHRKLIREIRNGKVVYVFQSLRPSLKSNPLLSPFTQSCLGSKLWSTLTPLLLMGMTTTIVGLAWFSFHVITDPDVAFWLNQFLPIATPPQQTAAYQPQTLEQILKRLRDQNQPPGQPIVLATGKDVQRRLSTAMDILIPIYDRDCSDLSCQRIQALHVYRSLQLPALLRVLQGKRYYRLLDRVIVKEPTESELVRLVGHPQWIAGASQPLSLSQIERYYPAPQPGSWLRLMGLRTEGNATATYGQVMYFHPDEARLVLMLNWGSPKGAVPQWQQVTGDRQPELVVDQTVGLEPQFTVYRLHRAARGDLQMERISLARPAFANPVYAHSLSLARSGLWTPALKQLEFVKQNQQRRWSAKAQAQLDVINLHAQVAQVQAKQTSASTVQTIVALLVNGEWKSALGIFRSPDTDVAEVRELLLADSGRLSSRLDTFLGVYPQDQDAIAWGAMIRHLQDDSKPALAWAQQKMGKNKVALQSIQKLLQRLDQPTLTPKESPSKISKSQVPKPQVLGSTPLVKPQPLLPQTASPQPSVSPLPAPAPQREKTVPKVEISPQPSPTITPTPAPTPVPTAQPIASPSE